MWGGNVARLVEHQTSTRPMQVQIPVVAKDFSPSQLSVQTLLWCPYTPVRNCMRYICVHVKDPVVHVRVLWIMGTLKHPACILGWVA